VSTWPRSPLGSTPTTPFPCTGRWPRTPECAGAVAVDDPRVACDTLVRDDGTIFAVLASHAAEPLSIRPVLAAEQVLDGVTMAPFGINVRKLTAAGATDLTRAG
jgi:hypothetical protein